MNVGLPSRSSRYRPEIDGLRAFAVVAVIINHFNKDILPGGYLGVDIFFVISGYVITSSLFGRPSRDFKDFISGFYERRIKRLVPALSAFVLIMSIAICLFNPESELSLRTGITSLFGLSNLYLLKQSTDYFAESTELNVFTHTWSLGVEEQFYILFPFLIWFSGFGRQTKNGSRTLFLVVGALTIASLVGFLYLYPTNQPAAYFLMPSRFWEMAAGCLIFIGFQKRTSIEQLLEKVSPLLLMALIVGVMYLPMSMAAASTIAVVALSSILIACLKQQAAAFKVFTNSKVVYIGLISYSLYLWHWGVLSISRWTVGIHWWTVPFQIALMLGLAVASYRWIETPLRKGNWLGKRWKTLVVGGGLLFGLSGGLFAVAKYCTGFIYLGAKSKVDGLNYADRATRMWDPLLCKSSRNSVELVSGNQFEKCWSNSAFVDDISTVRIFTYGNSYNHQLSPIFRSLSLKSNNISLNHYFTSGCTSSNLIHWQVSIVTPVTDLCAKNFNAYLEFVKREGREGDVFIVANSHSINAGQSDHAFFDSRNPMKKLNHVEYLDLISGEYNKLGAMLSRKKINLFVTTDIPVLSGDPLLCGEWFGKYNNRCPSYNEVYSRTANKHRDLGRNAFLNNQKYYTAIDLMNPLIEKAFKYSNHYIYYYNSDHLSVEGALFVEPIFRDALRDRSFFR